eukprot:NODE_188_length_13518_cov_0.721142.p3 type:complete len:509 gc:universal NODE_188_length_13518_cov_0.721142:7891-6365(-)
MLWTLTSAVKYCTPDMSVCAEIYAIDIQRSISITLDYNSAVGWLALGTGSFIESSNLIVVTPNSTTLTYNFTNTESNITISDSDYHVIENSIVGSRGRLRLIKSAGSPFFTDKISTTGFNTFNWATGINNGSPFAKISSKGKFKISSLYQGAYVIDDSDYSKTHGSFMILGFLVFLPCYLLLKRFYSSYKYSRPIEIILEGSMWVFALIGFIVIAVAKRDQLLISSHSIGSFIVCLIFLILKLFKLLSKLKSLKHFALPKNFSEIIYYLIDNIMVLLSSVFAIVAASTSFSILVYLAFILSILLGYIAIISVLEYKSMKSGESPFKILFKPLKTFNIKPIKLSKRSQKAKNLKQSASGRNSKDALSNEEKFDEESALKSTENTLSRKSSLNNKRNNSITSSSYKSCEVNGILNAYIDDIRESSAPSVNRASIFSITDVLQNTPSNEQSFSDYYDTLKRKSTVSSTPSRHESRILNVPSRTVQFRERISYINDINVQEIQNDSDEDSNF